MANFSINGKTYMEKISENGRITYWVTYEQSEKGKVYRVAKDEFEKAFEDYRTYWADDAAAEEKTREMVGLGDEEHEGLHMDLTAEEEAKAMEEAEKWLKDHGATLPGNKSSKPRKSKDVAHEAEGVTLTAKQVDFIKHLPDTCFWENGLDSCIWVDCLCDDIGGQFKGKPMTVGAMISTLCEKGLGSRCRENRDGRKCTSFELTELGKKVAAGLGL